MKHFIHLKTLSHNQILGKQLQLVVLQSLNKSTSSGATKLQVNMNISQKVNVLHNQFLGKQLVVLQGLHNSTASWDKNV